MERQTNMVSKIFQKVNRLVMTDMKKSEAGEGVGCNLNLPEKLVLELRPDGGKKASWGYPNDVPAGEAACEYA